MVEQKDEQITYNYVTEDIFTTPEQAYEAIHARTYVFL